MQRSRCFESVFGAQCSGGIFTGAGHGMELRMDAAATCRPRSGLVEDAGRERPDNHTTLDGMNNTDVTHEIAFWDHVLETRGSNWKGDFDYRMDPGSQVASFMLDKLPKRPQVLDVGAGPLTGIGKWCGDERLYITAVDPLAAEYDRLLEKHNIKPIVRTRVGYGEGLYEQFGPCMFDLVHAQNSVDHSHYPMRVILEMLSVTKPGGWVTLLHHRNEGEKQGYVGMHGWNFDVSGDDLVLWNKQQFYNATHKARHFADCSARIMGRDLVFAEFRKREGGEVK